SEETLFWEGVPEHGHREAVRGRVRRPVMSEYSAELAFVHAPEGKRAPSVYGSPHSSTATGSYPTHRAAPKVHRHETIALRFQSLSFATLENGFTRCPEPGRDAA